MFHGPIPLVPELDLAKFDSGARLLDEWLAQHALAAHRSDSTKVFVVHDDARVALGFYALSAGSVVPDVAPERVRKGQGRYPVPVGLITRLGVDRRVQGQGLGGALLKDALLRLLAASDQLGIRAIHAQAKDDDAKRFYANYGFEPSLIDPRGMFMLMKDLRASMK